jgi:hypothetical protein
MSSLGEAVLDLTADDSRMVADINNAKGKVLDNLKSIGQDMTRIGQGMTVALTLPLLALGKFSLDAAMEFEDTKNKAQVVFGDMADNVIKNAERADQALGLSEQQYLDYASSIQAALTAGGMGLQEAADLSEGAVKTFADLASFHGGKVEDVAAAWQSAIRGQYESVQKYFPFINDSYLKTYGAANGLVDENIETLTANQRAIILNAISLDQDLNPALNDFAETAESPVNKLRSLRAEASNAAVTLGNQLLPYAIKFMELLSKLVTWFETLNPEQQKWVVIIGLIVAVAGPLLIIIGSLITAFTAIAGAVAAISAPVLIVIGVIAALITIGYGLYLAWMNNLGGIQDKVNQFANAWRSNVLPVIQSVWGWMSGTLFPFLQALANFMGSVFGLVLRASAGIWQNVLKPALMGVFSILSSQLMPVFTRLTSFFNATLLPIIREVARWVGTTLVAAFNSLSGVIKSVTTTLNKLADGLDNIDLPGWMTPGSPTPWEIGLRGVGAAIKDLNSMSLPNLTSNLNLMPAPAAAGGNVGDTMIINPSFNVDDRRGFDDLMRSMRTS